MSADEFRGDRESVDTLRTSVIDESDHVVLRVEGELDIGTVPVFVAAVDEVLAAGNDVVLLDLEDLTFIDSSGVGAYVAAFRRARSAGRSLSVGRRSPFVHRVLQISGVEEALPAEST